MNKRFIAIIIAVIALGAGFMWLTKPKANNATGSTNAQPSNHVRGGGSSGVTLVEYGDFQCPACGQYYPIVTSVVDGHKDTIFFQFRNFPLESIHQNARAGSRAAEAASLQGKFWEMYDALYQNQQNWVNSGDPLSVFTSYAKQIGITDTAKFESDYKSVAVNDVINADLKAGAAYQITGTPTFILDGKKIENPASQDAFNKVIDDAIASKTKK